MDKYFLVANANPVVAQQFVELVGPRLANIVEAASFKPLNRYNLKEDRIFGTKDGKKRFKILRLSGDRIVFKDIVKDSVDYVNVNDLVELWNATGVQEISPVNAILQKIKEYLTPLLGTALVAFLISWLLKRIG